MKHKFFDICKNRITLSVQGEFLAGLWRCRQIEMRAYSLGELRSAHKKMSESGVELLVQERIEGSDSQLYSLYAYLNRNWEPLALCVIQKLRQWPVDYGSGSYSVTCRRDEVVELGLQLLKTIG